MQQAATTKAAYVVKERGANYRVWAKITRETNAWGSVTIRTNSYVELKTGMGWLNPASGQFEDAQEGFEISAQGYAVARRAQHQVVISPVANDAEGTVDIAMPGDGRRLRSTLLALNLYERASGRSLLLGEVTNAVGMLVEPNTILFSNCFSGFSASVRYVNRLGEFHQDVLLSESLDEELLRAAQFPPETSQIEIWTEFFEFPEPAVRAWLVRGETDPTLRARMAEPDVVEEEMDFGPMTVPVGKAYVQAGTGTAGRAVEVHKRWMKISGRTFMVESIPLNSLAPLFARLPPGRQRFDNSVGQTVHIGRRVPVPVLARKRAETIQVAKFPSWEGSVAGADTPQLVLDYVILNSSQTNFTFRGDSQYFISGSVTLKGTNFLEGGTIIKFSRYTNSPGARIGFTGSNSKLICRTAPYRPAIFTAMDDDSVGIPVEGSTGNPTNSYGVSALYFNQASTNQVSLHDIRVSYATIGVSVVYGSGPVVTDAQFVNCSSAFQAVGPADVTLRNVLVKGGASVFAGDPDCTARCEHVTFHQVGDLIGTGWDFNVYLTNSLLVATPTNNAYYLSGTSNQFLASDTGVFQSVGAGRYYLATNSPYRNAGTTNISAALLAELRQKTTYPPMVLSNVTITTNLTLGPRAIRDTDPKPALGYHYDTVDYITVNLAVTNATLTITNGAAIAYYNDIGIDLQNRSQILCQGTPTQPNHFLEYEMVQEQPVILGTNVDFPAGIPVHGWGGTNAHNLLRFTRSERHRFGNGNTYHLHWWTESFGSLTVRDCFFSGGSLILVGSDANASIGVTNNCFENVSYADFSGDFQFGFRNNLFKGGWIDIERYGGIIRDNIFDSCYITANGWYSAETNAYINAQGFFYPTNGSLWLTNFAYATGPLGNYYQSSTNLVNKGSRTADLVGLYHYTTATNQMKETNSTVDIGFHSVAVNTNGLPIDTDGDGLADYFEDSNGDGTFDSGDLSNFRSTDTDGDGVGDLREFQAGSDPKTGSMVVAWGDNSVGQCTVPLGISNAVAVAGGGGQSLALLNGRMAVAWGRNTDGQGSVPTNVADVAAIAAGWMHNVALLTNGTVIAWGLNGAILGWHLTEVPSDLTNAIAISVQAMHSVALRHDGTVVAWGYNANGETNVPSGLSNVVAIAAGYEHNLAAKADGTVVAWGYNGSGQCNVPVGLSNVVSVAAGTYHSLALLNNGTVVAWGDIDYGATSVPVGLSNVIAIAAGGDPYIYVDTAYSLALKSDGTLVAWGDGDVLDPLGGLSNVIAIAGGADHALAVCSGPMTPVITLEPTDQYQIAGGNVTFAARGAGLYGVKYQWQFNGVNISGETNEALTLADVHAGDEGDYRVIVSNELGSIVSSNAHFYLVTAPVINSLSPLPTNRVAIYQENLTLNVVVTAPGQSNGFPLAYQWKFNGTNLTGANSSSYTLLGDSNTVGTYSVTVTNAAGSASATWHVTNVTFVGSYIDVGTLAYYLSTNAVGYANGYSGSAIDQMEVSGWTNSYPASYSDTNMNMGLLTNSVWSTNFWLKGVQGLSATPIGLSNGVFGGGRTMFTMVSPRHFLFASHTSRGQLTAAFLDTNNVIHWRKTVELVDKGRTTFQLGSWTQTCPRQLVFCRCYRRISLITYRRTFQAMFRRSG